MGPVIAQTLSMTRLTTLLALLLLTTPALAGTKDDLVALYQATGSSPTPNMTFFNGLSALGSFDAGPDVMAAVENEAELPNEGLLGAFLSGITRFQKSGSTITLTRGEDLAVVVDGGYIKLEKRMVFRLTVNGARTEAKIDKVDWARVGESSSSTYPLRRVTFERKDPLTYVHINAGYGLGLNKTKSVVAIDTSSGAGVGQSGLSQALPGQQ